MNSVTENKLDEYEAKFKMFAGTVCQAVTEAIIADIAQFTTAGTFAGINSFVCGFDIKIELTSDEYIVPIHAAEISQYARKHYVTIMGQKTTYKLREISKYTPTGPKIMKALESIPGYEICADERCVYIANLYLLRRTSRECDEMFDIAEAGVGSPLANLVAHKSGTSIAEFREKLRGIRENVKTPDMSRGYRAYEISQVDDNLIEEYARQYSDKKQ